MASGNEKYGKGKKEKKRKKSREKKKVVDLVFSLSEMLLKITTKNLVHHYQNANC